MIHYTIHAIYTNRGMRYRVQLWNGRVLYEGTRDHARYSDAEMAARRTGAKPAEELCTHDA